MMVTNSYIVEQYQLSRKVGAEVASQINGDQIFWNDMRGKCRSRYEFYRARDAITFELRLKKSLLEIKRTGEAY